MNLCWPLASLRRWTGYAPSSVATDTLGIDGRLGPLDLSALDPACVVTFDTSGVVADDWPPYDVTEAVDKLGLRSNEGDRSVYLVP